MEDALFLSDLPLFADRAVEPSELPHTARKRVKESKSTCSRSGTHKATPDCVGSPKHWCTPTSRKCNWVNHGSLVSDLRTRADELARSGATAWKESCDEWWKGRTRPTDIPASDPASRHTVPTRIPEGSAARATADSRPASRPIREPMTDVVLWHVAYEHLHAQGDLRRLVIREGGNRGFMLTVGIYHPHLGNVYRTGEIESPLDAPSLIVKWCRKGHWTPDRY